MRRIFLQTILALSLVFPVLAQPMPAFAACPGGNDAKGQVVQGIGSTGSACDDSGVTKAVHAAVNILSFVVGIVAIIMIILAGFKYITSGGEAARVGNAKSTLIYAIIGLAIAALAQILVHFVLFQTHKAVG